MKIKILFALSAMLLSLFVKADPWSGKTTITNLYPATEGLIFMTTYANTELSLCDGGKRFVIVKSHPNYEVLVSTMLAAFMSEKEISFNIDSGQQPTCSPTINRFLLYK